MKYIAVFDIPDGYTIGCALAKIAPKGKEVYEDSDFENAYAQTEPLSEKKAEVFERFNVATRVMQDLGLRCAYDMPSFWCNGGKDYTVIPTKYHKGYMQALEDVEKEIRLRFGFAEMDDLAVPLFMDCGAKMEVQDG
jgi:hypothetical protein